MEFEKKEEERKKAIEKYEHQKELERIQKEKEKENSKKKYSNPVDYYKTFNSKPVEFKKKMKYVYSDSESDGDDYSSSSYDSSSSDGFPSPETPRKRKKEGKNSENYEDLFGQIQDLQRRICEMEIEKKKKKHNK